MAAPLTRLVTASVSPFPIHKMGVLDSVCPMFSAEGTQREEKGGFPHKPQPGSVRRPEVCLSCSLPKAPRCPAAAPETSASRVQDLHTPVAQRGAVTSTRSHSSQA